MRPLNFDLEAFDAEAYLEALTAVAASDGLHADEEAFIRQQAIAMDLDPTAILAAAGRDLAEVLPGASAVTRRMIYRDCYVLAHVDGEVTERERAALDRVRDLLELPRERASALESWADRYSAILLEGERLMTEAQE